MDCIETSRCMSHTVSVSTLLVTGDKTQEWYPDKPGQHNPGRENTQQQDITAVFLTKLIQEGRNGDFATYDSTWRCSWRGHAPWASPLVAGRSPAMRVEKE